MRRTSEARQVITPESLAFIELLARHFGPRRRRCSNVGGRSSDASEGASCRTSWPRPRPIREGSWTVAPAPADLNDRRVEITGPVERKMMINALNSGAKVFMADFEDALSPTWRT